MLSAPSAIVYVVFIGIRNNKTRQTLALYTNTQLQAFLKTAQSLKLYRRAEINDEDTGKNLIKRLYVDPLPNNHVLQTILKRNTTFIIGRKGTGKSTIFQRAQEEIKTQAACISAYVDVKTLFESSQLDPALITRIQASNDAMSVQSLERFLLHRSFLRAVIAEIKKQLEARVKGSIWQRVKNTFKGNLKNLFEGLEEVLQDADDADFMSILGVRNETLKQGEKISQSEKVAVNASLKIEKNPSFSVGASDEFNSGAEETSERSHSDILIRIFDPKVLIERLKALLEACSIAHLYIFLDDFSELPLPAMEVVVDCLLAPLNNWSNELIKFKVAAYPGRIYYGSIDKTKIDEIHLDTFKLYGVEDVNSMEEKAIDFTKRLVEARLGYFGEDATKIFGETQELWREIFYATMGNPRNLGYLLYFIYELNLLYDKRVTVTAVREAARKYYDEKIEAYFAMNRFLHDSFSERASIFSLKELLEEIISRARDLRRHSESSVIANVEGTAPTSHFHIVRDFDSVLATLELNFFISKYYEQRDRDGREVSVYALNYGLCQKHSIKFGRPSGRREHRLYFVERIFDYSDLIRRFFSANQEIICPQCEAKFETNDLPALKLYGMRCPKCGSGTCEVINLSRKYEPILKSINENLLLPETELGILFTLHSENRALYAADIAAELDCSGQLIGRRAKNLGDRKLVTREHDADRPQLRIYELTEFARQVYFTEGGAEASVKAKQG